ncbi:MAG: discoidin domain-containing protein [Lewinellaceae bacterium]|nr:discoidin domain-containing protein [Lewinellaceae bacterium]
MPIRPLFLAILLATFAQIITLGLSAQDIQLNSRYSYYTSEADAVLILYGEDFHSVQKITAIGGPGLSIIQDNPDNRLFYLDIRQLKEGKHNIDCQIQLVGGQVIGRQVEVVKLSPRPNEVKVDRLTGGLLVDGLPFYPFGFYASFSMGNLPVEEVYNAMNLVGVYQPNDEESLEARKAYMDQCAALGIKVNYAINGLVGAPHDRWDYVMTAEEGQQQEARLRREVETFRDHPALLSWYMNDEPVGQGRAPELLEKAYRTIQELDPYHPVSVVFVVPDKAAPFRGALDIAMTDPYPIPGDVNNVRGHLQALERNFRYQKAIWMVPQAFGGGEYWQREPTAAEIRVMTYLGIYEGAMGMQYFIRRGPNLFPKSRLAWNECTRIAHEVGMLLPYFFSKEGRRNISTQNDKLLAAAWPLGDTTLIIVINSENQPKPFSLSLDGIPNAEVTAARLPFENRQVAADNRLEDMIDAYGVRMYLLEKPKPEHSLLERHNLFPGAGFEHWASPGVPQGCSANSSQRPSYDGSHYFLDARTAHSGHYALRLHNVTDTSHFSLAFSKMPVNKGQAYQCALWLRRPENQARGAIELEVPELNWKKTLEAGAAWTLYEFHLPVGKEGNTLSLIIHSRGKGTVWVDDISLAPDPIVEVQLEKGPQAIVAIQTLSPAAEILYRTRPDADFQPYDKPLVFRDFTALEVALQKEGQQLSAMQLPIPLSLATFKDCTFRTPYSPKYQGIGDQTLLNGRYGSLDFRDGQWLGFNGKDIEFTVDLGEIQNVSEVVAHFLVSIRDGIHAPLQLAVEVSTDGKTFQSFGKADNPLGSEQRPDYYLELPVKAEPQMARYVRFKIKSPRTIPEGFLFSGTDAWVFIDEVLVR